MTHTASYLNHCILGCHHERHVPYQNKFVVLGNSENGEYNYYYNLSEFVLDENLSPLDDDDFEMFQDIVFESPWGRVHIFFYEQLFKIYYEYRSEWTLQVFSKYLTYLNRASTLFTQDAFGYIFNQNNVELVERVLKELPFEIKMQFIRASEKYPAMLKAVPKLRLYNLFS